MSPIRRNSCLPTGAEATLAEIASQKLGSVRPFKSHRQWDRISRGAALLWCFTASDIKTMVLPVTTFGILSALGGAHLFESDIPIAEILARAPLVLVWTWLNVLLLSISNQRSEDGIAEDGINKPWRPIPSGKISAEQSRRLLLAVAPVVMIAGSWMGISRETFWALAGSWYYSDLGGADENWMLRQFLNGLAYEAYGAGACRLLVGSQTVLLPAFWIWLTIISIVVGTTIQVQDLKDEAGDRLRNRNTAPIVLGNSVARGSVVVGVLFWSLVCPMWWQVAPAGMVAPMLLGDIIAYRVATKQNQAADKKTFLIWSFWMISLFTLPTIKRWTA